MRNPDRVEAEPMTATRSDVLASMAQMGFSACVQIFAKMLDGRSVAIEIPLDECVHEAKVAIEDKEGIPVL